MRIKRVECDQFAGLQSKEIEFEKGLNIVVGDNESGKSTLVDLIYQLLFKDVKLDGRSDAGFIDNYFPKNVKGPLGDVIDGVLVFETPSGTYKLKKEWEKGEGTCRLTLPNGTSIKGNTAINEILMEELKHRAGVYNEIIFASQKRDQFAIESIMRALGKKADSLSETRTDLASTLNQAALETGGVSLDKMEKALENNLNALIGRWDYAADAPEGGPKRASYQNAWANGAGTIVKAYYEADEVRSKQKEAEETERAVETENECILELQKNKDKVDDERMRFQRFSGMLGQRTLLTKARIDLDTKIREQSDAKGRWPGFNSNIEKAMELKDKQRQAQVHDLYLKAEPIHQEYLGKKSQFEKLREVDPSDLTNLQEALFYKQTEEGKLAGMNLVAKIKKLGSAEIIVTTVSSDKILDYADGEVLIKEAVDINIPGVMDMQLLPKDVDVEMIRDNLKIFDEKIKAIYGKYSISSLKELQDMSGTYNQAKQQLEQLERILEKILGDKTWEDIKAENDSVPVDIETEAEINIQIANLCGLKSVDEYIGGLRTTLDDYKKKYESIEKLQISIDKLKEEMDENQKNLDSMEEIPEEFRGIDDPDRYDKDLEEKSDKYKGQIGEHDARLKEAQRKLGDKSAEEYSDELLEKEAALAAKKSEYEHWKNIYNVFIRLKEQTGGNPVEDIETKFREYLGIITDGKLKLDSMDEKMSVQLASGDYALTYDILSDGTKDTISLAFRLAMLEHLYPEGDGLAIFDDPFTDMDPKRVEQSCKLIQKYAEKNQVIFVTCDDKYKKLLSGNVIAVQR